MIESLWRLRAQHCLVDRGKVEVEHLNGAGIALAVLGCIAWVAANAGSRTLRGANQYADRAKIGRRGWGRLKARIGADPWDGNCLSSRNCDPTGDTALIRKAGIGSEVEGAKYPNGARCSIVKGQLCFCLWGGKGKQDQNEEGGSKLFHD